MSASESAILRQIERLQTERFAEIEAEVAAKRRQWVESNRPRVAGARITVRQAYELFFADYLGLDLDEVAVVRETEERIVWRSTNRCSTLEACKRAGLDTRRVCRLAYDKPTQTFFSTLDPTLRFHRSYEQIRPHAAYCEEWLVRVDFEAMMQIAIEEAKRSRAEGNKGYGAVVVYDGEVVSRAHDTAVVERDPSLHAEVNAIRQACRARGDANLAGAVLFSTCEPCPMCAALAVWANVTTIVFGASIGETAGRGKARIMISADEVVSKSPALVEVIGGVLREECLGLY